MVWISNYTLLLHTDVITYPCLIQILFQPISVSKRGSSVQSIKSFQPACLWLPSPTITWDSTVLPPSCHYKSMLSECNNDTIRPSITRACTTKTPKNLHHNVQTLHCSVISNTRTLLPYTAVYEPRAVLLYVIKLWLVSTDNIQITSHQIF